MNTLISSSPAVTQSIFQQENLFKAILINFVWINASEIFRYFVFVMPMMRDAFPSVPDVAPMNLAVFMVWGLWDCVLIAVATLFPLVAMQVYGASFRMALVSGTAVWAAIFVLLWLGLMNMNLATANILMVALPLAWFEMIVASFVVKKCCF